MYATMNVYNADATIGIKVVLVDKPAEDKLAINIGSNLYMQLSFTEARQLIKRLSEVMADEA